MSDMELYIEKDVAGGSMFHSANSLFDAPKLTPQPFAGSLIIIIQQTNCFLYETENQIKEDIML